MNVAPADRCVRFRDAQFAAQPPRAVSLRTATSAVRFFDVRANALDDGCVAALASSALAVRRSGWPLTLTADAPVRYTGIEEHYKYGSIGSEPGVSLLRPVGGVLPPYWVFRALPTICRDRLPGGYASFGFIIEPGHDLPVGVSRRHRIGIDHVGLNCAACHSGTVRDTPTSAPRLVLGMPAHQLDLQGFVQFVLDCTLDSRRHRRSRARARSRATAGPTPSSALLLRTGLMDRLKLQTLELKNRIEPDPRRALPRWGRGPRGHVQSLQGDSVQLGSRSRCRPRS